MDHSETFVSLALAYERFVAKKAKMVCWWEETKHKSSRYNIQSKLEFMLLFIFYIKRMRFLWFPHLMLYTLRFEHKVIG